MIQEHFQRGFRELNIDTHRCLTASLNTIHKRLEKRGDINGSFPYQQTAKYIEELLPDINL